MGKTKIGVIDYGMGNLHSVKNALDYLGCDAVVTDDMGVLDSVDGLILPGVGAFPDAIDRLKNTGMDDYIKAAAQKKPILGICLGMQLLFDRSHEFRLCDGLGLIHGEVVKITHPNVKVPHMGWNGLDYHSSSPLTEGLNEGAQVYFVHSFKAEVENRADLAATADYNGEITAIVQSQNVLGCQFHPEKSGEVGLKILENYRRYVDAYTSCN